MKFLIIAFIFSFGVFTNVDEVSITKDDTTLCNYEHIGSSDTYDLACFIVNACGHTSQYCTGGSHGTLQEWIDYLCEQV